MSEVAAGEYGQVSIRFAKSPLLEVSVVDQPPNTTPDFVGSFGFCKLPAVKKELAGMAEPPLTSQETVFELGLHDAVIVEVPAGAV